MVQPTKGSVDMSLLQPLPRARYGLTARIVSRAARRATRAPIDMASIGVAARIPAYLRATSHMESFFMSRRRRVSARTLELVTVRAAMEIGCTFCLDLGSYMLTSQHGVSAEELADLADHQRSPRFSDAERAALDLAVAMTATPPTLTPELDARLREHFDDRELLELTAMIGWENHRARANLAAGLTAQGYAQPHACALATPAAAAAHEVRHGPATPHPDHEPATA